jgi:CHAT domain-containing protein/tetratricopeptide (TPR) repeat protein
MKISEVLRNLFISGILTAYLSCSSVYGNRPDCLRLTQDDPRKVKSLKQSMATAEVEKMNLRLYNTLTSYIIKPLSINYITGKTSLVDSIINKIEKNEIDSLVKSDSYYYSGIFFSLTGNANRAVEFLKLSYEIRKEKGIYDIRSARTLYNIAVAYRQLGDLYKMEEYAVLAIGIYKKIGGESNLELVDPYTALTGAYIELQETAKALEMSSKALFIAENNPESISAQKLVDLYSNLGVCYSRMADFSKARIYSEKAEIICESNNLIFSENYINLINSLAIVYSALGLKGKSFEYYQKGVNLAMTFPESSYQTLNIINSFAISLADSSKFDKAEELYLFLIKKAEKNSKENPLVYYEFLNNYSEFLREYKKNYTKSLDYDAKCMAYLNEHPEDYILRTRIYICYSLSLSKTGDPASAIKYIQELINKNYQIKNSPTPYSNPLLSDIKPDKLSLRIFKAKYNILQDIYAKTNDSESLKAAAVTSELIITLLEKMRINISEEESRLILGDKYRELYFNAISTYKLLYTITSDKDYLNKTFEFAEKSKVAGLLSSTRELKASQFQIPSDLADLEFRLKLELGSINEMISEFTNKENVNKEILRGLNDKLLKTTRSRDSLISVFEKQFPGYYSLKYNSRVASFENIPEIVGRNGNYVNYIMSDSVLYIFTANRKFNHLISMPIDSVFRDNIKQFRGLLTIPDPSEDAASAFLKYQKTGYELYKKLIYPIRNFLISEKLIISPDNILSYIPFETLPTNTSSSTGLQYRSLHYLMEDFDISYTYSATFMAESVKGGFNMTNKSVSFAPNYPDPIDIGKVLTNRQEENGILRDLPYARLEAEYVSGITNGSLYENTNAKESVFKKVSGNFDIIHLAMHTLMNDKDPMRSTLIFSPESDTLNDGYLKTFEVYGLPLKAKMVVLSSCNTGSGFLSTGEGILSLARGFIYSGSESVVMSMWEIEDRSGTDIVKMFYSNLKKGYSKSESLRRARIYYLRNSDQLRSHPYFWSALVVYGNNNPLYYSRHLVIWLAVTVLVVLFGVLIARYFWKRR